MHLKNVLNTFYMNKSHPFSTPMIARSLEVDKDEFGPIEDIKNIFGPEASHFSLIGTLNYLINYKFDITLLTRFNYSPCIEMTLSIFFNIFKVHKILIHFIQKIKICY